MKKPLPLHQSSVRTLLALLLLLGQSLSAVGLLCPSVEAAALFHKKKAVSAPSRPFLPPSSQMNDYLPEETSHSINGSKPGSAKLQRANVQNGEGEVVSLTSISGSQAKTLNSGGVQLRPKVERLDGGPSLLGDGSPSVNSAEAMRQAQQQVEQRDLGFLWNATVERNQVMRFSLEKLSLPDDLQAGHSSKFLRKTLSVLLSGAAIGATMMSGGGGYQNMGILTASNAVDNMLRGKQEPVSNLTPTEHIQLADLVDQLKVQLVDNYNQLGQGLRLLDTASNRTQLANAAYSEALAHKNQPVEQLTHAVSYYQALMQETRLTQRVSLAQLQLARIAGKEAVHDVQLSVMPAASFEDEAAIEALPPVRPVSVAPANAPIHRAPVTAKPSIKPVTKVAHHTVATAKAGGKTPVVLMAMAQPTIAAAPPLMKPTVKPVLKKVPLFPGADPFKTQVIVEYAP